MTKEQLKSILKQFEYETCHKRMKITQFHDTYVVCRFEELVVIRCPWDPADIDEDVEVIKEKISLIDIARAIDEMPSAYWHTIAMDLKEWYLTKKLRIDTMRALNTIKSERKMLIETGQMSDWRLHHIDRLIDIYEEQLENC